MNRRHFITSGGLGLPMAGSLLAAGSGHDDLANPSPDIRSLADTTLTRDLLNLTERFKQPVIIREITIFRRDRDIWAQVRSQDGVPGRGIGSARQASLISILETLVIPFFLGKDARRIETLNWFEEHLYGQPPRGIRSQITWQPAANPQSGPAAAAEDGILTLTGAGGKQMQVPLKLYRPPASQNPLPTAIFICNRSRDEMDFRPEADFWPMEQIVKAGWLTVAFNVKDVAHDEPAELIKNPGLLDLDSSPAGDSRGGALSAWAFIASELREHLTRRADVASDRISVIGHSRGGKAARLAGARDPGFAVSFSSNSGCGGGAHNLTKKGEKIADITKRFPTWFCRKFSELAGREHELPYDQHHLLGCIAPRMVYVSSASGDAWADPLAEYLSCQLASPIHQFVGAKGLSNETSAIPAPGEKRHGGSIGYHLRQGPHNLTAWDWLEFPEFAQNADP